MDEQATVWPASNRPREEVRATPLEAAQRIRCLHLDDDFAAKSGAELLVGVLRSVQEDRIDNASSLLDAGDTQIEVNFFAGLAPW